MGYGERELIALVRAMAGEGKGLVLGIGDDCAAFCPEPGRLTLVTSDALVAGVHFDLSWHPAHALGRKAAAVNLSDIAAMGGTPRFALLNLALPTAMANQWLDEFMAGFLAMLGEHGVLLIGGDTVASPHDLMISVTVTGEVAEGEMLSRKGARPGDLIMVSGQLGEAAAGLALCRQGLEGDPRWQPLLMAHLDPAPQVGLGLVLGQSGLVHALQDISDGLATDLAHICAESGVGAVVEAEAIPVSPLLMEAAGVCGHSPLAWALSGGEDYQLLLTVPADKARDLSELLREKTGRELFSVGRIVAGRGVILDEAGQKRDISFQGYEHLKG